MMTNIVYIALGSALGGVCRYLEKNGACPHSEMKAFLFDMDGVIVDNTPFHVKSWVAYSRELGNELTPDRIRELLGLTNAGYLAAIFGREATDEEVAQAVARKESLYRELIRPHLREAMTPGLVGFLCEAERDGIPCAVVTGGPPENVDFVVDGLGIRRYFRTIVDATQYERGKPAPDCYLACAARLGLDPRDCMVFEDAEAGIASALAAGMQVTAIATTHTPERLADFHPTRIWKSFVDSHE